MKVKVFYPNEKGNIELTKEKLEALLTEAYNEGYADGNRTHYWSNGYAYCASPLTPKTTLNEYVSSSMPTLTSASFDAANTASKGLDLSIEYVEG